MDGFETNENEPNDLRDVAPSSFRHVIGQQHVVEALQIAVEASFNQHKRFDETLLCGPPGLGKTALVNVVASELAVPFTEVLAQSVSTTAELNNVLMSSADGILFLDEIHLLNPAQQHSLLQVIDKRRIFLSGGKTVQSVPVSDFTLIGATTDPDGLIQPLLDRFRIVLHLDYYSEDELADVVRQRCLVLKWSHETELLNEIAQRAKGTPRIALRLLQSANRVCVAEGDDTITVKQLLRACSIERISELGLDNVQQKYLRLLGNGPVRLNVLSSMLGVSTKAITKTVEPYLLRAEMIVKSDGGQRQLSEMGRNHLSDLCAVRV